MQFKNLFIILIIVASASMTACTTVGGVGAGKNGATSKLDGTSDDFLNDDVIQITQTKRGVQVRLQELLLFESGKANIKRESGKLLDQVAAIIKEKTKKNVAIEGHTDNVGSKQINARLSGERAEAIKAALIARGVDGARLRVAAFDFQQPVADNATEKGRAKNRRVEIFLLDEKIENVGGQSAFGGIFDAAGSIFKGISGFFQGLFN